MWDIMDTLNKFRAMQAISLLKALALANKLLLVYHTVTEISIVFTI